MTNKNYQIAKFYARLFELKDMLNGELLPLAAHIGIRGEDARLFESLEILATDIGEHLEAVDVAIKKVDRKSTF